MTPPQWFAPLPAGFARAPKIGRMRSEFGSAGVAIPAVLLAEAETQKQLGGRRGVVRLAYDELAYLAGVDAAAAREVVERWVALGEMDDADFGDHVFEARWCDWDLWQEPVNSPELARAVDFLRGALDGGPVLQAEVSERANEAGISDRTLKRGRAALGVIASKVGPRWMLALPPPTGPRVPTRPRK